MAARRSRWSSRRDGGRSSARVQTSRISADFFSAMSLTLPSNRLVRVWISSLQVSRSSSVRILSVCSWSACLLASRRMFRMATRASSARSLTRLTSFLRCSTESEGTFRRTTLLSELGVRPRSLAWIALTMSPMTVGSNGRIRICCGSGVLAARRTHSPPPDRPSPATRLRADASCRLAKSLPPAYRRAPISRLRR